MQEIFPSITAPGIIGYINFILFQKLIKYYFLYGVKKKLRRKAAKN